MQHQQEIFDWFVSNERQGSLRITHSSPMEPVRWRVIQEQRRINMQVAKVIGNIWATRKEEKLSGLKLLLVKPLDVLDETVDKSPLVAADTIGAGVGETVIIVGGSSARNAAGDVSIPVDATVVGIVDDLEIDRSVL